MGFKIAFLFFLAATVFSSLSVQGFRGGLANQRNFGYQQRADTSYATGFATGNAGGFNGGLGGFNDAFKNQMAVLLAEVTKATTPETMMLKNKLMIGLISIDNTLSMINKSPQKERELKPILQHQVKNFMNDLDVVQDQLAILNGSKVIGDSNYAGGKVGIIKGSNNAVFGNQNLALGNNNILQGNRAILSGNGNEVRGSNGVTVGTNNRVDADSAFVFSNNDVVTRDNTLTIRDSTIDLERLANGGRYITRN